MRNIFSAAQASFPVEYHPYITHQPLLSSRVLVLTCKHTRSRWKTRLLAWMKMIRIPSTRTYAPCGRVAHGTEWQWGLPVDGHVICMRTRFDGRTRVCLKGLTPVTSVYVLVCKSRSSIVHFHAITIIIIIGCRIR